MRTKSWTVALLLFDEIELLDVAGVAQALTVTGRQWNWRPFKIATVARSAGTIVTRSQLRIEAAHDFESCPASELLVVPGGYGARAASEDPALVDFVRQRAASAALTGALGYGSLVLARAGLLAGIETAATPEVEKFLLEIDSTIRASANSKIVESGNVVTARSGSASLDLALAIVTRLLGKKQALAVAAQLDHEALSEDKLTIDILPPIK